MHEDGKMAQVLVLTIKNGHARAMKLVVGEEMACKSKEVDGGRKEGRQHNFVGFKKSFNALVLSLMG